MLLTLVLSLLQASLALFAGPIQATKPGQNVAGRNQVSILDSSRGTNVQSSGHAANGYSNCLHSIPDTCTEIRIRCSWDGIEHMDINVNQRHSTARVWPIALT